MKVEVGRVSCGQSPRSPNFGPAGTTDRCTCRDLLSTAPLRSKGLFGPPNLPSRPRIHYRSHLIPTNNNNNEKDVFHTIDTSQGLKLEFARVAAWVTLRLTVLLQVYRSYLVGAGRTNPRIEKKKSRQNAITTIMALIRPTPKINSRVATEKGLLLMHSTPGTA